MPQPGQAYAPGSPASSGSSIIGSAIGSLLGGGAMGGLSSSSSSGATSGDSFQGGSSLNGSMNINYGNDVTQGAGAVPWAKAAAVAGVVALIIKRFA